MYEVVAIDDKGFTVWDGQRDSKHPGEMVGTIWVPGDCPFQVGDQVDMIFRQVKPVTLVPVLFDEEFEIEVKEEIIRCETHNVFHKPGLGCKPSVNVFDKEKS